MISWRAGEVIEAMRHQTDDVETAFHNEIMASIVFFQDIDPPTIARAALAALESEE